MEELTLMQKFADPQIIESLSAGEKATGALITTIMGMGITFIVLILLWGILALFARIFEGKKMQTISESTPAPVTSASAPVTAAVNMPATEDDAELAAVIAAAIAASTGQSTDHFVVRKINRASGFIPAWGKAGQKESLDSRRM